MQRDAEIIDCNIVNLHDEGAWAAEVWARPRARYSIVTILYYSTTSSAVKPLLIHTSRWIGMGYRESILV